MFRVVLVVLSLAMVGLSGCGKTNPASDYNTSVKTRPSAEISKAEKDQSYLSNGLLRISVAGDSEDNVGNFFEGRTGHIQINVAPYPGIPGCNLASTKTLPEGASLTPTSNSCIWNFTWTPAAGTVPSNSEHKAVFLHLISSGKTNDPAYTGNGDEATVEIIVSKKLTAPVINGVSGFPATATQGDQIPVTVDVTDTSNSGIIPELSFKSYNAQDKENKSWQGVIQQSGNVQNMGGGRYIISAVIFTDGLDKMKGEKAQTSIVELCNYIKASANGLESQPKQKCVNVNLTHMSPTFVFPKGSELEYTPITFTAGQLNTIEFHATIGNQKGVAKVTIDNKKAFDSLPGHPEMTCKAGAGDWDQDCTISWSVPCKVGSTYRVNFTAANTGDGINGKPVAPEHNYRDFNIVKPASCTDSTSAPNNDSASGKSKVRTTDKKGNVGALNSGNLSQTPPDSSNVPGDPNKVARIKVVKKAPGTSAQPATQNGVNQ